MNKVILIGRITKDPELKATQSGTHVVSFSLAVDGFKDQNGDKHTDFISCVAWKTTADYLSQYVRKGYKLAVAGRLQTRSYDTGKGENRTVTEVVLESVENLTPKENEIQPEENKVDKDDLPF